MSRRERSARGVALFSLWLSLLSSAPALAADPEPSDSELNAPASSESDSGAPEQGAVESREPTASTPEPSAANPAAVAVGLGRLSGAAYPEPYARGLAGGSLWLNMQGHQWPYMPRRAGEEATRIGLSGNVWVDTSYQKVESGLAATDPSIKEWRQQSRLVLRATPTFNHGDDYFVQGQGEVVLQGAAPTRTEDFLVADDLYVRAGQWKVFDITAGRFQGWEVYHLGMGLDLNTVERNGARTDNRAPVDIYGLTYMWDRPNGPGRIAAHYYATDYLRFELLGQVGSTGLNVIGGRPVGILDVGFLKLKLGAEYQRQTPRQDAPDRNNKVLSRGVAGSLQLVLDPVIEGGVQLAHTLVDTYNVQGILDAAQSLTTTSYGAFANARVLPALLLGAGANYTHEHNLKLDMTGELNDVRTHLQVFGAAQYLLWDQLFIKGVVAYANAHFNPESNPPPVADFRNKALSARLRLMYLF